MTTKSCTPGLFACLQSKGLEQYQQNICEHQYQSRCDIFHLPPDYVNIAVSTMFNIHNTTDKIKMLTIINEIKYQPMNGYRNIAVSDRIPLDQAHNHDINVENYNKRKYTELDGHEDTYTQTKRRRIDTNHNIKYVESTVNNDNVEESDGERVIKEEPQEINETESDTDDIDREEEADDEYETVEEDEDDECVRRSWLIPLILDHYIDAAQTKEKSVLINIGKCVGLECNIMFIALYLQKEWGMKLCLDDAYIDKDLMGMIFEDKNLDNCFCCDDDLYSFLRHCLDYTWIQCVNNDEINFGNMKSELETYSEVIGIVISNEYKRLKVEVCDDKKMTILYLPYKQYVSGVRFSDIKCVWNILHKLRMYYAMDDCDYETNEIDLIVDVMKSEWNMSDIFWN